MKVWREYLVTMYRRFGKRVFDCMAAGAAFLVLLPVIAVAALFVRIRLGSPILFRQQRPGLGGESFRILKFRTMTDARDAEGRLLPDAERLTRLGRFLRSTSLDELPELINVLKGEMSLVGPRPLKMEYLDYYTPEEARRHDVRPGITGWSQVNGRNAVDWPTRLKQDIWYVDNMSFWLDLKILSLTVFKVFKREGISAEGHATMPSFVDWAKGEGRRPSTGSGQEEVRS